MNLIAIATDGYICTNGGRTSLSMAANGYLGCITGEIVVEETPIIRTRPKRFIKGLYVAQEEAYYPEFDFRDVKRDDEEILIIIKTFVEWQKKISLLN